MYYPVLPSCFSPPHTPPSVPLALLLEHAHTFPEPHLLLASPLLGTELKDKPREQTTGFLNM